MSATALSIASAVTLQDGPRSAQRDEFTGMVLCPPRMSHLAVMACWAYQQERGCGFRCPNAVTREQALAVVTNATRDVDSNVPTMPALPERETCECGRPKTAGSKRCADCFHKSGHKDRVTLA